MLVAGSEMLMSLKGMKTAKAYDPDWVKSTFTVQQRREEVLLCVKVRQQYITFNLTSYGNFLNFNFTCQCTCGQSVNKH